MVTKYKNLVVGCGLSGTVLAYKIASELNEPVTIIDSREHVGGNIYDYRDNNGICIHKYGPHIFHTNNKEVWDFISQFTKWYPYQHHANALIDGNFVPIPFNLNSLHSVFPSSLANRLEVLLLEKFGFNRKVPILELRATGDSDLKFLVEYIYQKVFLEYTLKQWGQKPDEIDPSVTARVPVYVSRDNRYFQDKYQGIPLNGYTAVIKKMLEHSSITVELNTKFSRDIEYERLFWTGSIDDFFNNKFGVLPYRSVIFDLIEFNQKKFQSTAIVNYPTNYDFTRITEYKHFLDDQSEKTVVSYEYPTAFREGENERQYPIVNDANLVLYSQYMKLAKEYSNVYFFGRLGDYKYYDMDKAIARVLELFREIKK
jgi:UDP-galactopyranose mutase